MNKFKFLVPIFFSVLIGLLIGGIFFTKYDNTVDATYDGELVYFIGINTFNDLDSLSSGIDANHLILSDSLGYHEYVAITKSLENAKKIKGVYDNFGNNTYIEEKIVSNSDFINKLSDYDKVVTAFSDEEINNIEKVVISLYKEMVNGNDN